MRIKIIKINGETKTATLLCGISGLVKVYSILGYDRPWLQIGRQFFTVQDELNQIVLKFISLEFQPISEQEKIKNDFINLCNIYK